MRRKSVTYNLYIDVLFLINFIMDFMLLTILRRVFKYHSTTLKLIVGSSVGAVWAVLAAIWPLLPRFLECLLTYIVISAFMVKIAFGLKKLKEIAKGVLGLYLTAVMMGGTIYALYQHTKAGYYVEQLIRGRGEEAMPIFLLLGAALAGFMGLRFLWTYLIQFKKEKDHLYEVTMYYRGREKTVKALMDTGNRLYEPVTHRPVHVVTYEALKSLCESVSAVVYIPFCSVGKKEGTMPGIFLDELEVRQGDQAYTIVKPLVAVCRDPVSPNGEYQMLLHEE